MVAVAADWPWSSYLAHTGGADVPYPPATSELHHEVEMVVALVRGVDMPSILRVFRGLEHSSWDPAAHSFHIYTLVIGAHTLHASWSRSRIRGFITPGEDPVNVALALPPAQASALLVPHHGEWSQALAALRMDPCWTLMAVSDEVDWPWDAAEPSKGPLAWVLRNDRKPGRSAPASIRLQ